MIKIKGPDKIVTAKKKKDIIIWLDMDGVCCYWEKAAAKTCGLDLRDAEIRQRLKDGARLEEFVDGGDDKMWEKIDAEGDLWWENLEKLPWTDDLIKLLSKETKDLSFLSSPSDSPFCYSGKIKWVKKHFPDMSKDLFLAVKKYRCAQPNSILIDDSKKKCKKFEDRGGQVFNWPSPLSILDKDVDIDELLDDLTNKIKEMRS